MHHHVLRRINPGAHVLPFNAEHGNGNLLPDHQGLTYFSRQNQRADLPYFKSAGGVWREKDRRAFAGSHFGGA